MKRGFPVAALIAVAGLGLAWPASQAQAQADSWPGWDRETQDAGAHSGDSPELDIDAIIENAERAREWVKDESQSDSDPAASDSVPDEQVKNRIVVGPGTATGANGRIAINLAVGSQNQQLSSAVAVIGGAAVGTNNAMQAIATGDPSDRETLVVLQPDSFVGNSGLISLNVSAGSQNQSANLALLALGNLVTMSDQNLEQTRAPIEPEGGGGEAGDLPNDAVRLSDNAFRDNSGLVQINLVGGERNSSANTFQLNVSAGNLP